MSISADRGLRHKLVGAARQVSRPFLLVVVSGVAGALTLMLDRAVPGAGVPAMIRFSPGPARTMLATLAGALLSIAVLTFWLRSLVVQLISNEFSPRLLARFLDDRFQQWVMALMLGAVAYIVVVFRGVPVAGTVADVPQISTLLGVGAALGTMLVILVSVHASVDSLEVGRVVRRMADDLQRTIADVYPNAPEMAEADPTPPDEPGEEILAPDSGWVRRVDDAAILSSLPSGATVRLEQRVGEFVVAGTPIATVWPHTAADERTHRAIRSAVALGHSRSRTEDLEFGFRQLVDVGEQALAVASPDSSTAYEVIVHLGTVMCALYGHDEPPLAYRLDGGARMLRPEELGQDQLMATAVGRLRMSGANFPLVAIYLLGLLDTLAKEVRRYGKEEHLYAIRRQAALVVMGCEAGDALDADVEVVRRKARAFGLPTKLDGLGKAPAAAA